VGCREESEEKRVELSKKYMVSFFQNFSTIRCVQERSLPPLLAIPLDSL